MEKRRYRTTLSVATDTPMDILEEFKKEVKKLLISREAIDDDSIIVKFDEITGSGLKILISSYTNSVDYASYLTEKENINYKIMKILKEKNIKLV